MSYDSLFVAKYLERYAEPEIQALDLSLDDCFESILVIPVYDEPLSHLLKILQSLGSQNVALILVFNVPELQGIEQAELDDKLNAQQRTIVALEGLLEQTSSQAKKGYFSASLSPHSRLFVLDYCRNGVCLSRKHGVGLARKLGMDFGLKLVHQQFSLYGRAVEWLHSSDADVEFPAGYFDIGVAEKGVAAAVYSFEHIAEPGYEVATELYDHSLRYYVDQLACAGSPYAFHTIGSLIAVRPVSYAMVRGFPKRAAGEDFYLLNKLAKVGSVHSLPQPIMLLSGRPSHRVPFGTGPALLKIRDLDAPEEHYTYYNPKCFKLLKGLLDTIASAGQSFSTPALLFTAFDDRMTSEESAAVKQVLLNLKIEKQFMHLAQKQDHESFSRAFHTWFDAFLTLRFIHELRDGYYPNVCFDELPELSSSVQRKTHLGC